MKVAIASGKGGTGKTTVAVSLAHAAAQRGIGVAYLDCDVEEPNGHLFLKPDITARRTITRPVAKVDPGRCTFSRRCEQVCQFSAIVCVGGKVLTYPDLCHGCGACQLACPERAIFEEPVEVGVLEAGNAEGVEFVHGILNIGQVRSVPLIQAVKDLAPPLDLVIFDSPPGTSCPVVETLRGADLVLLVADPTPFGFYDFRLAVDTVIALGRPLAAVINRADLGDDEIRTFCAQRGIPILVELPDDRAAAEAYATGEIIGRRLPAFGALFDRLLNAVIARDAGRSRRAE